MAQRRVKFKGKDRNKLPDLVCKDHPDHSLYAALINPLLICKHSISSVTNTASK